VRTNTITQVYRGVQISNFVNSNFGKFTANNIISLKADHVTTNRQWGVNHSNDYNSVVNSNTITGFNASTSYNSPGIYNSMDKNSSVQCNSLSVLPIDVEFAGSNSIVWRRNTMANSSRGIQLSSNGFIGGQGTFSAPSDNVWQGSWVNPSNNTFIASTPHLSLSVIYTRTLTLYKPINNGGSPFYGPGTLINANNSAPYITCSPPVKPNKGGDPIKIGLAKTIASGTLTYNGFYPIETNEINKLLLFQELEEDDTLMNSDLALQAFFTINQAGYMGALSNIAQLLSHGDLAAANTAITNFAEGSTVQANYKLFYQLYLKYVDPNLGLSPLDKSALTVLATKCPFKHGAIIYNARALNTLVTGSISTYSDNGCDLVENSMMFTQGGELSRVLPKTNNVKITNEEVKDYYLYPNPAIDKLQITSRVEKEDLTLEISDLSNKLISKSNIQINNFATEIELNLINGIYLVTLVKANNERIVLKLIISK
jgi:hypothetical protein